CNNNSLASLNVSGSKLTNLSCSNNSLTTLNASGLSNLQRLDCNNNSLASLNVSETSLIWLFCSNNNLTSLDTSGLTALRYLDVRNNLMANENAVTGVTDAVDFVAWETGDFYFSPQRTENTSTPGFAILATMVGLLCALVLFKWQRNREKK
ncbi:MAG: hypothetical protein FWH46_06110, partial [Methanimicrococcus sp.]|nr:hypothetical protein [Methanimicrococcus sp.]